MIDVSQLKEIFQHKKDLLIQKFKQTEYAELESKDEADHIQNQLITSMASSLSIRDKIALHQIDQALLKINSGDYGKCEECEELISEKRLLAVPDCRLCIYCAEIEEKEAKQYRG